MNKDELLKLRQQVLNDILPLASEGIDSGVDQFSILLRVLQAGGTNVDVYKKAYEAASLIEEKIDRLDSLVSLLDEINYGIQETSPEEIVVEKS